MPYLLDSNQIKSPHSAQRTFLEVSRQNTTLTGITKKQTLNRKEKYTLHYDYLSLEDAAHFMSLYENQEVITFEVTDSNFTVAPVDVLIDIGDRNYPPVGDKYREAFDVVLTEVR